MSETRSKTNKSVKIVSSTGTHEFGTNLCYAFEFARLLRLCGESFEWIEIKSEKEQKMIKVERKRYR